MQETQVQSLGKEDPQRRKWQPTPVFLPRKPHRQRSLLGYSPWGHKRVGHDLVTTQQEQSQLACPCGRPLSGILIVNMPCQKRDMNPKCILLFLVGFHISVYYER